MSLFSLLKTKDPRVLFLATLVGTIGEGIFYLATIVTVSKRTDSVLSLGVLFALTTLPSIFLAPFQGVLIDGFNKVKLAVWANILRAVIILVIPLALWADFFSVTLLYVTVVLYYVLWYFLIPATESLLKDVMSGQSAVSGMAIVQAGWQVGGLGSALVAGLMIDRIGLPVTFAAAAVMDIGSGVLLNAIEYRRDGSIFEKAQSEARTLSREVAKFLKEMKEGWSYITGDARLVFLLIAAASAHPFYQAINTLIAPYNYSILKGGSFSLGLIESGAGLGSLISAVACVSSIRLGSAGFFLLISELLLAATVWGFSATTTVTSGFFMYVAIGLFAGNMKVLAKSLVLELTHNQFSGRVMTAVSLLGLALGIVTSVVAGYVADISIHGAYYCTAIFVLLPGAATLLWLVKSRRVTAYPVLNGDPKPYE